MLCCKLFLRNELRFRIQNPRRPGFLPPENPPCIRNSCPRLWIERACHDSEQAWRTTSRLEFVLFRSAALHLVWRWFAEPRGSANHRQTKVASGPESKLQQGIDRQRELCRIMAIPEGRGSGEIAPNLRPQTDPRFRMEVHPQRDFLVGRCDAGP